MRILKCSWLIPALLVLAASSLFAQTPDFVYEPPKDYATEWARNISLTMTAGAAGLILFTLVAQRRRLGSSQSKWLLFLGVCVVPVPVMVLSTAVGLEQAKAIAFCRSCHVMGTFVEDMEDPASQRLAAIHFKNRYIQENHCFACHTDYGLFGSVHAKIGGLGHIWQDATGTYVLPVKIEPAYRFTICLNCHGQSQKFRTQTAHAGIVPKTLRGEITCADCHGLSHPPRAERSRA